MDDDHTKELRRVPPEFAVLLWTRPPNSMTYTDDNGVDHDILLPMGTMHAAWDHLRNKRWDELAKFAPFDEDKWNASTPEQQGFEPVNRGSQEQGAESQVVQKQENAQEKK